MTTFDDRENAFEAKFALDEAMKFKADARRNKLLGLWAAGLMGKDAEAAAAVGGLGVEAPLLQLLDEAGGPLDGLSEGLELGDLRPYVLVHPYDVHAPVAPGPLGKLQRLVHRDAEFVSLPAGRYVVVAAGVHVRVDPQ